MPQPSPLPPSSRAASAGQAVPRPAPRGFTLIELLVVIGIIALLAGILIPAVSHVRIAGYETATKNQVQTLMNVIEQYHNTFNYYPGPIPNNQLKGLTSVSNPNAPTGTENGTIGLIGGWVRGTTAQQAMVPKGTIQLTDVTQGQINLNLAKVDRYPALVDATTGNLDKQTNGTWVAGGAKLLSPYGGGSNLYKDTTIPEFLDRFPDPLPILYIRANIGASGITASGTTAQYNLQELTAYNFPEPNAARKAGALAKNKTDPYLKGTKTINEYFFNPNSASSMTATGAAPYGKDGYILISAGRDRVYGSLDDLDSFGSPK